jgi:hypothetical protein
MTTWLRQRGAMIRIGLIVVAIAAGAFALNMFLFDAAESTGSAGRLSPRADELPTVTTETRARATTAPGRTATTSAGTTTSAGATTASDDRGSDDDGGSDDRSGDRGSDDSSGSGSGDDDSGRGRGRGRGSDD